MTVYVLRNSSTLVIVDIFLSAQGAMAYSPSSDWVQSSSTGVWTSAAQTLSITPYNTRGET